MNKAFANVKGVLFDLDGVVHMGDSAIPGAAETLHFLDDRGTPYRFITNTTTHTQEQLFAKMTRMGLPITIDEIITTHQIAANYLRRLDNPTCYFLFADSALPVYDGIAVSETHPSHIVIGDIRERWSYALLNDLFALIMDGAEMIALHKGRYWQTEDGLKMDIGAFVAALEYTTGKEAVVVGKPSSAFFQLGISDMGLKKNEVIMIGDDIDSDVGAAQQAGLRGILVETGKYRKHIVERSHVRPDATIASVADLQHLL